MDPAAQQRFNQLRRTHFPPERNVLDAHLTLFHHLPGDKQSIVDDLASLSAETPVFMLKAARVISLGAGVAFLMEDERLTTFHKLLQHRWQAWLIAQDKQKRRFHVTVQNKVTSAAAERLLQELGSTFQSFPVQGTGLTLWAYKNGPWERRQHFPLVVPANS